MPPVTFKDVARKDGADHADFMLFHLLRDLVEVHFAFVVGKLVADDFLDGIVTSGL